MMTPEDSKLGEAVFRALLAAIRRLDFHQLAELRGAYNGTTRYEQLSDNCKRKLVDIGLAAVNARVVKG